MSFFSSAAYAAANTTSTAVTGSAFSSFVPLLLIFVVFYFLLIRPQQKKIKTHEAMVKSLKKGERVLTAGGIIGTISKVKEDSPTLHVEIAPGVTIEVNRTSITENLSAKPSSPSSTTSTVANDDKKRKNLVEKKKETLPTT